MENAVSWAIKTKFVPHRKHITSPAQSQPGNTMLFEVFTAVTIKNAVLWDIKTKFVTHRGHITFPLQSPAG
jgi:hypothetical protein